jgi:selenocysteine lyase/cysteine desulfurase
MPWAAVRADFPALARHTCLNAAAASPTPRPVRAAVEQFHRELEEDGDAHWEHWLARREEVRASVARFVNASPGEIAFVANTSAGINAIADLIDADGPIVTDTLEFPTVTLPFVHRGCDLRFVEPREDGALIAGDFCPARCQGCATVLVSHVQFSNGCRQDLDAFGTIKGERHLVVCGSQSAGAFPVDVRQSRIDAFATAGHKWLCAGYGAGFVYVARHLLQRPPRSMGWLSVKEPFAFDNRRYELLDEARRLEMGCPPFAQIFALGAAVDYLLGIGIPAIAERVLAVNTYLTDSLARIGVRVLSPGGAHRSGETLCGFSHPAHVVAYLAERNVQVTEKPEGIRVATHFYNDEQDVDRLIAALREYRAPG